MGLRTAPAGVDWARLRPSGTTRERLHVLDRDWIRTALWAAAAFLGLVVVLRLALPKSVPFGLLLFGIVIGSINALIAVDLILIYRSNRIINFALAEIGIFGVVSGQDLAVERQLTRHGADRKAVLLEHAEALFLERGYEDTRMVDIADRAGVAKGLVYWYFANKEALFREIIADTRDRLRKAMAEVTGPLAADPLGTLYVGTVEAVRFIVEHHRMFSLIYTVSGFGDAHNESAQLHASDAARVIEDGQRAGTVRADEQPLVMAHFNAGVVNQAVTAVAVGSPIESAAHAAARYVVRALASSEELADVTIAAHGRPRRRSR